MILGMILTTVLIESLDVGLFLYLIDQKVSIKKFIALISLRLLFNSLSNVLPFGFLTYLSDILFYSGISFLLLKNSLLPPAIKLFQGLLYLIVTNLSLRIIGFFVYPLFSLTTEAFNINRSISIVSSLTPLIFSFFLIKLFKINFKILKRNYINQKIHLLVTTSNIFLIIYWLVQQGLVYIEDFSRFRTLEIRQLIVVIYIILFFLMLIFIDRSTRDLIQKELDMQKDIQLKNLNAYNHNIEELYQTVRSFRHDYKNLLTTLKLGIDQNDMAIIQDIYSAVLKDSNQRLESKPFDLARLINIRDNTLKSLLSAKFLQAEAQNIDVSLEIPDPITLKGMAMIDFITTISILIDNAMEATVNAKNPQIMIAYIRQKKYQQFIIKNTTKEESTLISNIFRKGASSKGSDRGIGLSNVQEILEHYPDVSLNTSSDNFEFVQDLIIRSKKLD